MTIIEKILDLARWAPSGDNEQPWHFEVINDSYFVIHGRDTSDWCVYDLGGQASQIAIGALLENIVIVASGLGYAANCSLRAGSPKNKPLIDVDLTINDKLKPSELLPYIEARVTQRRPLRTRPLTIEQKQKLEAAVGHGYRVLWVEGRRNRWQMAKLLFRSAYIRLTIPEAYEVHKQNIEWGAQFSQDKIPDQAVGVDAFTLRMMRWALKSWKRVQMMNKYFAGTILPRVQMDLLPGYLCGVHFCIMADHPCQAVGDYFQVGGAVQRFWLTATSMGLQFQPEMTPLIFSRYSETGIQFTDNSFAIGRAAEVSAELGRVMPHGGDINNRVFMGRLGYGHVPRARSMRCDLEALRAPPH